MMYSVFCELDTIVRRHTEAFSLNNRPSDLKVVLIASVTDEQKECILNDIDYVLRDLVEFSHTYDNGKLQIIFN